jgi:hypothetical protein
MSVSNLFSLIRQEDVCLWIGSGFSIYAGYPSANQLKSIFYESLTVEEKNSINEHLSLSDFTEAFVRIKDGSRNELMRTLRKEYLKKPIATDLHDQLSHIPHFKSIITTNYDEIIESSYQNRSIVLRDAKDVPFINNNLVKIYKVHGDLSGQDLVITASDYSRFYNTDYKNPYWSSLINELSTKNILFLGYGFEDPNFWACFDNIDKFLGANRKQRFFISPNIDPIKQGELTRKNIEYIGTTGEQFLNELTIDLKNNIVADFENKKVSVETFISYLAYHDLKVSIEVENQIAKLKSLQKISGTTRGHLTLDISTEKYKKLLDDFREGKGGRILELPTSEISKFETTIEGFKLNDNINTVDRVFLKYIPFISKKISIIFPKKKFEIDNLEFQAYKLADKIEITASINGFSLEISASLQLSRKFNFTINVQEPEIKLSVRGCLEVYKLLYYGLGGEKFKIYVYESKQSFTHKLEIQQDYKNLGNQLRLYQALLKIEQHFHVKFLNFNNLDQDSFVNVNRLISLIENKYIIENFNEGLVIEGKDSKDFIKSFVPTGVIPEGGSLFLLLTDEESINLLGIDLKLDVKEIQIVNVNVKDVESITYFQSKDNLYVTRYSKFGLSHKPSSYPTKNQ